jgi:hypothetical protein
MKINNKPLSTNDLIIRSRLREDLKKRHANDNKVRIFEELGVQHGTARVDIAVVNGILHGYEIKSDKDTLDRLPEQIEEYNAVFDKITLVVGKRHLYHAINMISDWWGVVVAKTIDDSVIFNVIREEELNKDQSNISIARLLWREEALKILEENGKAEGYYSKSRSAIYEKLAMILDRETLSNKVRETLFFRPNWRLDVPLVLNGD